MQWGKTKNVDVFFAEQRTCSLAITRKYINRYTLHCFISLNCSLTAVKSRINSIDNKFYTLIIIFHIMTLKIEITKFINQMISVQVFWIQYTVATTSPFIHAVIWGRGSNVSRSSAKIIRNVTLPKCHCDQMKTN